MLQQQAGVPDSMHLVSPGFGGMEAGLRRIYRRGRRARQYALEFPTTAHFHELRKRVKDLWHASLVLYHAWPEMMSPLSVELKKASDLLGYEHDLAVLQEYLSEHPVPGLDAAGHLQADHQLLAERKRWQVLILEITGLLYAEAPASFTRKIGRWWEIRQENTRH